MAPTGSLPRSRVLTLKKTGDLPKAPGAPAHVGTNRMESMNGERRLGAVHGAGDPDESDPDLIAMTPSDSGIVVAWTPSDSEIDIPVARPVAAPDPGTAS